MKKLVCLVFAFSLLFSGCNKDEPTIDTGDIYVTVYENSGYGSRVIEGANVFTVPVGGQGITDEFGTTLLRGIEPGNYEIYADYIGYGSGKSIVRVVADSLVKINITLVKGLVNGFTPEIEIILPTIPANFTLNEEIVFSVTVKDNDTPNEKIDVVISSSLDGELLRTHPSVTNNVRFETSTLSRGIHEITIKATDSDGYSNLRSIQVSTLAPAAITLNSATPINGGVQLKWEKYSLDDFKRYEVIRAVDKDTEGEIIASFGSIDSISYLDKLPPMVKEIYYYIRIVNTEEQDRNSNKIAVDEPAGKIYYYSPIDALHHPSVPIIYVIDNASQKLIAINYETQTEFSSETLTGQSGKMDIGDNGFGLEIYVPNDKGQINIYDAATLNFVTTIKTDLATRCVVTNSHGYLVATLIPSPWWEQPVRTYSRETGINISGNPGNSFEGSRLRFIPNSDNIIAITTSVSPIDMDFIEINNDGNILSLIDDKYHGDHRLDPYIFRISPDGEYLVTSSSGAVYTASNSMLFKGEIDKGSLYFSDFVFSNDAKIIYAGTSNRTSIQIIKYPGLTRNDEILLKGYPEFLFHYKDEIVSISKISMDSDNFAIERIKID